MRQPFATLAALLLPAMALAQSPFDGTWKADLDKNQRFEKPDAFELSNGIYACKSCTPAYSIAADGREHPVSGNSFYDSMSIRIVDAHTITKTAKKAGKTVAQMKVVVSADGRTHTVQSTVSGMGPEPVKLTQRFSRLSAGPAGSHALSGTWKQTATEGSDNVDVTSFKISGEMFSMWNRTGQSFVAKLDGTEAPYVGDPGVSSVSLKRIDARTIEETHRKDGAVVMVARWSIDPDGRTMHARFDDTHGNVMEQSGHKLP